MIDRTHPGRGTGSGFSADVSCRRGIIANQDDRKTGKYPGLSKFGNSNSCALSMQFSNCLAVNDVSRHAIVAFTRIQSGGNGFWRRFRRHLKEHLALFDQAELTARTLFQGIRALL